MRRRDIGRNADAATSWAEALQPIGRQQARARPPRRGLCRRPAGPFGRVTAPAARSSSALPTAASCEVRTRQIACSPPSWTRRRPAVAAQGRLTSPAHGVFALGLGGWACGAPPGYIEPPLPPEPPSMRKARSRQSLARSLASLLGLGAAWRGLTCDRCWGASEHRFKQALLPWHRDLQALCATAPLPLAVTTLAARRQVIRDVRMGLPRWLKPSGQ